MLAQVEAGMLAGQDDAWSKAAGGERVGDGCKLDRFGAGANDQPNR